MLRRLFALLVAASFAFLPQLAPAQFRPAFTQQELDQMLAPIALYPDALLSQMLMAATYPLEVVEAARWSAAYPGLSGAQAVRAIQYNDWDPSVKSMVAFPQIIAMMSARLDWTERLGDAFLGQEYQVMDTVQRLRQRAYAAGYLRSSGMYLVDSQGQYITVRPASPDMAYVPYYDPSLVYGPWWWPEYPPVYWAPWRGYRARPDFGDGLLWGLGIRLGVDFFFGAFDWRERRVAVANANSFYRPRDANFANRGPNAWQHDPNHRRSVPYREAQVRDRFVGQFLTPVGANPTLAAPTVAAPAIAAPERRREFRGQPPAAGQRATAATAAPTPPPLLAPAPANQPAASSPLAPQPRPHILEGVGRGAEQRNFSARGRASAQTAAPAVSAPAPQKRPDPVAAPKPSEKSPFLK